MANASDYAVTGMPNSRYIDSFLHPDKAYKGAEEAEQQGWDQAQSYQKPFWQQGQDQYGRLNDASGQLLNPTELESKWASSYETSPYAKRLLEMNKGQGLDAASSMGLMGSSAALGNIQQGAADITSKDREMYMKDLMQKYMAGIGISQNIYGVGANAGANLGRQAMQHGENQAGLEYGRIAAPGKLFGQVAGTAMNAVAPGSGNAFTGQGGQNQYNSYGG